LYDRYRRLIDYIPNPRCFVWKIRRRGLPVFHLDSSDIIGAAKATASSQRNVIYGEGVQPLALKILHLPRPFLSQSQDIFAGRP
jgi:hypothetical protein